jgi:hypothetical protein
MRSTVHVDVKVPGEIAFVLSVGELRSRRNRPSGIGVDNRFGGCFTGGAVDISDDDLRAFFGENAGRTLCRCRERRR